MRAAGNLALAVATCTGLLVAPNGLGLVAEYRRLRAVTDAPVKVPVPGPYTLAGCLQGGDVYPNTPDLQLTLEDMVVIARRVFGL